MRWFLPDMHSIPSYAFVEITWFMRPSQCVCDIREFSHYNGTFFFRLLSIIVAVVVVLRWGNFIFFFKKLSFLFSCCNDPAKKVLNELLLMISIDNDDDDDEENRIVESRNFFPSSFSSFRFINNEAAMKWDEVQSPLPKSDRKYAICLIHLIVVMAMMRTMIIFHGAVG